MSEETELDVLRKEIKDVTVEIIRLVGKRMDLVESVWEIKKMKDLPIENLNLEQELKQIVLEKCQEYIRIAWCLQILDVLCS